jgi:hypothetical protein
MGRILKAISVRYMAQFIRSNVCRYCIAGYNKGDSALAVVGRTLKTVSKIFVEQVYTYPV